MDRLFENWVERATSPFSAATCRRNFRRAGSPPEQARYLLSVGQTSSESARGLAQSKSWRPLAPAMNSRSVLDCASPLALWAGQSPCQTLNKYPTSGLFHPHWTFQTPAESFSGAPRNIPKAGVFSSCFPGAGKTGLRERGDCIKTPGGSKRHEPKRIHQSRSGGP